MKAGELLPMWLKDAAAEQRVKARNARNGSDMSKTPWWIGQQAALAEAYEESATVFDRHLAKVVSKQEEKAAPAKWPNRHTDCLHYFRTPQDVCDYCGEKQSNQEGEAK